jgi:hypothetical protein
LTLNGRRVAARTSAISARAPAASVAPTEIEPSAPALDTAAASAGVDTVAIGAWMIGSSMPRRSRKLVMIVEIRLLIFKARPRTIFNIRAGREPRP